MKTPSLEGATGRRISILIALVIVAVVVLVLSGEGGFVLDLFRTAGAK